MDWTGGTRRRFAAGRNNATVQKQKAHFAKARAALHATSSSRRSFRLGLPRESPSIVRRNGCARARTSHGSSKLGDTKAESGARRSSRAAVGARPPVEHFEESGERSSSIPRIIDAEPLRPTAPRCKILTQSAMTDEEKLLLAHRRHLLARTDWLGLNAIRPAHIEFASSGDKERIGKRRKVKHTDRRGHLEPTNHLRFVKEYSLRPPSEMSHVIDVDNVQVKIGTDALASHTQPSRASHHSGHTSMRQPSTDFVLLSEESMLLGSDGDPFEASTALPTILHDDYDYRPEPVIPAAFSEDGAYHEQHIPQQAPIQRIRSPVELECALHKNQRLPNPFVCGSTVPDTQNAEEIAHIPNSEVGPYGPSTAQSIVADSFVRLSSRAQSQEFGEFIHSRLLQHADSGSSVTITHGVRGEGLHCGNAFDPDDEDVWRRFVHLKDLSSGHASMAALKSSSLHLTDSNQSDCRRPSIADAQMTDHMPLLSTPKGAGTQGAMIIDPREEASANDSLSLRSNSLSPSTSLLQITKLAQQAGPAKKQPNAEVEDNELWRSFVLGSRRSSSSSQVHSLTRDGKQPRPHGAASVVVRSPSPVVSGLGDSNMSTFGATSTARKDDRDVSGGVAHTYREPKAQPAHQTQDDLLFSAALTEVGGYRPADTAADSDSLVEPIQDSAKRNIHASRNPAINRRRFRQSHVQRQSPRKTAQKPQFDRKTFKRATEGICSVFDLVDSDGMSIA